MPVPETLPFDETKPAQTVDISRTLLEIYLPPALFALNVTRTGERTFRARYIAQEIHCNPQTTPLVRGRIQKEGARLTNSFTIDEEDPEGHPSHTIGHIQDILIFPGNLGIGSVIELAGYDQPMDLVEVEAWDFKGPGLPGDRLVAAAEMTRDDPDRREFEEAIVRISGRDHLIGTNLVFEPAPDRSGLYLPQYREYEIIAQMAGGGLPELVGPVLGGEIAAIYDSVWKTRHRPSLIRPGDELVGEIELYDLSELTNDGSLGEFDISLYHGRTEILVGQDVSLAFFPKRQIRNFINEAIGGVS